MLTGLKPFFYYTCFLLTFEHTCLILVYTWKTNFRLSRVFVPFNTSCVVVTLPGHLPLHVAPVKLGEHSQKDRREEYLHTPWCWHGLLQTSTTKRH